MTTIQQRAEQARELAAAYSLRKQGNAVEALLTGTLSAVQRTAQSLVGAETTLSALPEASPKVPRSAKLALTQLEKAKQSIQSDAIAFVQTDESQDVTRALETASADMSSEATRCWDSFRASLDSQFPEEFVRAVSRIPAFAADARIVTDAWETIGRVRDLKHADTSTIARLRDAREKVDQGLERLNAHVGSDIVRRQSLSAVNGVLRLTDVDPEFTEWVIGRKLEQSFRVSVR